MYLISKAQAIGAINYELTSLPLVYYLMYGVIKPRFISLTTFDLSGSLRFPCNYG